MTLKKRLWLGLACGLVLSVIGGVNLGYLIGGEPPSAGTIVLVLIGLLGLGAVVRAAVQLRRLAS